MMGARYIHVVLFACGAMLAAAIPVTEVSAQKYPERRVARGGNRLYEKGDFAGAEAAWREALTLAPGFREAGFNLGNALLKQEKVDEAAEAWMNIAADSLAGPELVAAANFNLGNAALTGQKIDEAIEFYKQSLRLVPDDDEAKYNLAYAQKLKQEQEQEQQQNGGENDDEQDKDGEGENDPQQGDNNDDKQNDGQDDKQDSDGDPRNEGGQNDKQNGDENQNQNGGGQQEDEQDGDAPPPPSGQGKAQIDPQAARQMLDAIQAEEDKTREEIDGRKVPEVGATQKNW